MSEPLGLGMEEAADRHGAFPRLDEEQRALLRRVGEVRTVKAGEVLFREGDRHYDFFAIESGVVAVVDGYGRENRVIAVHGAHRFLGELNLLTGAPPYLTAVMRDAGEVIQVSVRRMRDVITEDEELTNLVLRSFLARRTLLRANGAEWSTRSHRRRCGRP